MRSKKYIHDRFRKISQYLLSYKETKEPEHLHHYRVEIKKLKALYRFLEYCDKDFTVKDKFQSHRDVFRQSGKIRDFDVIGKLLRKYKINFIATTDVTDSKKHLKEITIFCNGISSYIDSLHKAERKLLKRMSVVHQKELHQYLRKRKKKIKQCLQKDTESFLHQARKDAKEVLYLSKLDPGYPAATVQYFDKLQQAIGAWHDKQVLIETLQKTNLPTSHVVLKKLKEERRNDLLTIKAIDK